MKHVPTYQLQQENSKKLDSFVDSILKEGFELFQDEFQHVDSFVKDALQDTSERSDHQLRQSQKERYLLELISFKIYDRLSREAFNKKKNTLIVIPDCISIHDWECQKMQVPHGSICRGCHPDCMAYQITELGVEYNATVVFSKKSLAEQLKYFDNKMGDTSVIGVACIMMLANGMRVAHEENIPARGVILHNTGCEHWNDEPFDSQFSIEEIQSILKEKYEYQN